MVKVKLQKSIPKIKETKNKVKLSYTILLFAYLFVPLFTPDFFTLDSNGPKFLSIAILNLVSMFVLLTDTDYKKSNGMPSAFFGNYIGLAYTVFVLFSLLSFTQAINLSESLVNFVKIFTVFSSTYVLYVIFSSNRDYVAHIALAMTFLLLFDCFTVFFHIVEYINKNVSSIIAIKSVYSNKNILSAALFVKIPVALWLMLFAEGWKKKLGYSAFLLGSLAVLFLSTRAFYLGFALLIISLALFFVFRYFSTRKQLSVKKVLIYTGVIIITLISYSVVQQFLYPKNQDMYNASLFERLSTIKAEESSANARLSTWRRSFKIIRKNPVLGVGTGNWKIQVLKYESPRADTFIVSYKNHNDFIEITAETGIIGGLAYLAIFILTGLLFIKKTLDREANDETVKFMFLPAFGILAYSMDAFFNFPIDRPEIQSLFALYVAMAITSSGQFTLNPLKPDFISAIKSKIPVSISRNIVAISVFLMLAASILIMTKNTKSLYYQHYVFDDEANNRFSHSAAFFAEGFPKIPSLSWNGAPINTYIAHYLINENRSQEAISLLMTRNPSPYDGRREYYLSKAYDKMGNTDSVIYWAQKVNALKPLHANTMNVLSNRLLGAGRQKEAFQVMNRYLNLVKTNPDAWLLASDQYMKAGNEREALLLLDTAIKYLPGHTQIANNRRALRNGAYIKPFKPLYTQAVKALSEKHYSEALNLFNTFIHNKPDLTEALQKRAICLYYLGKYSESIFDINCALQKQDCDPALLYNLRGVNYISLGKTDDACVDFDIAMKNGNADGASNYRKFCGQKP